MTQNLTPAERSKRAESAERVVVKHKGRDYPMAGAAYSALLDRAAAKVAEDELYQRLYGGAR